MLAQNPCPVFSKLNQDHAHKLTALLENLEVTGCSIRVTVPLIHFDPYLPQSNTKKTKCWYNVKWTSVSDQFVHFQPFLALCKIIL